MEGLERLSVAFSVTDPVPEALMLKEQVVEEVLARLREGESVVGLARAYDVDPKTIRAWRQRRVYRPRERRGREVAGDLADVSGRAVEARARGLERVRLGVGAVAGADDQGVLELAGIDADPDGGLHGAAPLLARIHGSLGVTGATPYPIAGEGRKRAAARRVVGAAPDGAAKRSLYRTSRDPPNGRSCGPTPR